MGITIFWGNKANNGISLSLKHSCPVHVEDWSARVSFFTVNKRVENSSTLEMAIKSYILELLDLVTVFKDLQAGIFVAEREGWIKNNLLNMLKSNLVYQPQMFFQSLLTTQ